MKSFPKLFAWASVSLTLAACSGLPIEEATDTLRTKPVCCKSFKDLSIRNLALGERLKFNLGTSSAAMEFPEGKSFLEAFAIPKGATMLAVQSMNSEYLPQTSYIDPILILLNKDRVEIVRHSRLDLRRDRHLISGGLLMDWYFGSTVSLPSEAAYVVVYADNKSRRTFTAVSDNGTLWPARPAPIGTIALIAK